MTKDSGLLIMIHCDQYTGYAVGVLESVFFESAILAGYSKERIFWSYKRTADVNNKKIIACDYMESRNHIQLSQLISSENIRQVLAFDLNYPNPLVSLLRESGVERIVSYWGAAMSSVNSGLKLFIKKVEWYLRRAKPDAFIFESEAMRLTATQGRGVPEMRTHVIPLGVDTQIFSPSLQEDTYAHSALNISKEKKIIFYSGHMEERKGVRVIMQAAIHLIDTLEKRDVHFVLCGNKGAEAKIYQDLLENSEARNHVTFAGYRSDIPQLMRSAYLGVIASTGWDSFTMSSVEMMASGLPLVVSNLQGLSETIESEVNGFLIEPGAYKDLAEKIDFLISNPAVANVFSQASRSRASKLFSKEKQIQRIASVLAAVK